MRFIWENNLLSKRNNNLNPDFFIKMRTFIKYLLLAFQFNVVFKQENVNILIKFYLYLSGILIVVPTKATTACKVRRNVDTSSNPVQEKNISQTRVSIFSIP